MPVPSEESELARPRPRRAVQERSRIARQRILDAAVRVLAEHGYSKASTLRIQKEAGVSRGGLLNHFPSRDELLVAAVHHLAAEPIRGLGTRTAWPDDPAERIAEAIDMMWATYSQPYFWASVELWVAGRSNEDLRRALVPAEHIMGSIIRTSTDMLFGLELCSHPAYPELRDILFTSMRGVAMTYALGDRDPAKEPLVEAWNAMARRTLLST